MVFTFYITIFNISVPKYCLLDCTESVSITLKVSNSQLLLVSKLNILGIGTYEFHFSRIDLSF